MGIKMPDMVILDASGNSRPARRKAAATVPSAQAWRVASMHLFGSA
jgi:hypothetical protein